MQSTLDRVLSYLSKVPPAISGSDGHGHTFATVSSVVNGFDLSESEATDALREWNGNCQPPWSDAELAHKIRDAIAKPGNKPRGWLLGASGRAASPRPSLNTYRPAAKPPEANQKRYDLDKHDAAELPTPIPDGTRALLKAAFAPGEGVRIVSARLNDDGREVPDGEGPCLLLESWLEKLDAKDGDPNGLWRSSAKTGIYIAINPLKLLGSKDSDVTAFRHALVEFDSITPVEQWLLYQKSRLPCTAIISSGGKSVHAWVKVDAKDRREYDERVAAIYAHFASYGLDAKNKNPSRLSRLPNCVRFTKRQELLALNAGCESFSEWLGIIQSSGTGEAVTVEELANFDATSDPNSVLGSNRWLCKGGSLLLVGQSGTGKSSLAVQMAVSWALGRDFFGIKNQYGRRLKSVFIQAENDRGDLAEMMQGVMAGMGMSAFSDDFDTLKRNLVFIHDTMHTGKAFTEVVRRHIDAHKPDLVFIDPLLSFIGDDISRQIVCSQFLREWLNPIADATGVVWIMVHHTNKPSMDKGAKAGWKTADHAYSGSGSSELTNWARAVMTLGMLDDGEFELRHAKRGLRSGSCEPDGTPTTRLFLRHASTGIRWEQCTAPPMEEQEEERKAGRPSKIEQLVESGLGLFIDSTPADGEGLRQCTRRLENFASGKRLDVSPTTCRNAISHLIETGALLKRDGRFFKG